jgi:hypothetical protein
VPAGGSGDRSGWGGGGGRRVRGSGVCAVQQPHLTERSVGVALLVRGDDRRARALLLRGVLGCSSFAATSDERRRTGSRRERRRI